MKALLLALTLVTLGCASSTAPTDADLSGTWAGTATVLGSAAGIGTVRATMTQTDAGALRGTWTSIYTNPIYNASGGLSGTVIGSQAQISLTSGVALACGYELSATVGRPSVTLSGTLRAVNCDVAQTGTFTLTKQ